MSELAIIISFLGATLVIAALHFLPVTLTLRIDHSDSRAHEWINSVRNEERKRKERSRLADKGGAFNPNP